MPLSHEKKHILLVDDSTDTLEVLQRNLTAEGYRVFTSTSVAEAIRLLDSTKIDLVVTDLMMPKVGGLGLVRHVHENLKDTQVMMITGYPSIEGAVEAVKTGAEEYLAKPFTDDELAAAVRRALGKLQMRKLGHDAPETKTGERTFGIVAESEAMRKVLKAAGKAAATSATVLISGESGYRKRARGAGDSLQRPAGRGAVRSRELRRHPRGIARERAFRTHEGRLHRSDGVAGWALPRR